MRKLLWSAAGLLILTGPAVVAVGLLEPYRLPERPDLMRVDQTKRDRAAPSAPPLSAFEPLWGFELQRPLYDAPEPVVVEPEPPPPPPLRIRLLGTVVKEGDSQAILMSADGQIEFKRIGQRIGEAEIRRIESESIQVLYRDELRTLTIEE